jgi:hypothetical protein
MMNVAPDGYSNIGACLAEFKNFGRDIKCYIGENDAQMFIGYFEKLSETQKDFYFAYEVNEERVLTRAFWCDAVARKNYALFGDSVSFDATYGTNKYFMVFTPFTGVDHHKKSVTFAAALFAHEDEESFKWVLQKFLDAMGNKEPLIFITDQDPALKLAVPAIFKNTKHRFCMWHIMEKLTEKVGTNVCKETDFVNRINSVVWDMELEPSDFEERWWEIITEFNLEDNSWLSSMYSKREKWISAYFRNIKMGCILRTTQRSESENSFFKRFEGKNGTLVEFWLRFQTAMEQQRYTQKCSNRLCDESLPKTITLMLLEAHASKVYTHSMFYEFRDQV